VVYGISRSGLRLLAVHAHPDDESSKGAAMMARYSADGVQVLVAVCTDGSRGDILNLAADRPENRGDIGAVRRAEIARACEILGVDHRFLGFTDSGFPSPEQRDLPAGCFAAQSVATAAEPLVRIIREIRPHVIVTYDESGGYPHPDHVMCHKVSVAAFDAAPDPGKYPAAGPPWQPAKLYYHANFHRARFLALHTEMQRRQSGRSTDVLWYEHWGEAHEKFAWQNLPVTTRVHCSDYFETRDMALLAHVTQIDPDGFWLAYPADVQRFAWPTEDFFLARSMVETELPEDDLFTGIISDDLVAASNLGSVKGQH
jgi:mycothiol S-conjugate amidase